MKRAVLVVGSPMLDVIALGASHYPRRGRTEVIDGVTLAPGGCALNAAVVLARLGVKTRMAGRVGDDLAGRLLLDLLRREPLDSSQIRTIEGERTTACLVFVEPGGGRQFLISTAAGETVAAGDVSDVAQYGVVHVGAALQLTELDIGSLFDRARAAGTVTTVDVENGPALDEPDRLYEWLPHVDWFLPSEEEALRATRCSRAEEAADRLRSLGARGVVVKLGERGCLIDSGETKAVIAPPQVGVADTTGAGDCFVAGFLSGLVWDLGAEDAARLACACGARAVTAVGATAGIRSRADVVDLLPEDLRSKLEATAEIDGPAR